MADVVSRIVKIIDKQHTGSLHNLPKTFYQCCIKPVFSLKTQNDHISVVGFLC